MENNKSRANLFGTKRSLKTAYDLLVEGAKAHTAMPRLRAEAERVYLPGGLVGGYVNGWHDEVEIYIIDSSAYFDKLSELDAEASLVGELSLTEMVRRRDRLNERIELRQRMGNIVMLPSKRKEG